MEGIKDWLHAGNFIKKTAYCQPPLPSLIDFYKKKLIGDQGIKDGIAQSHYDSYDSFIFTHIPKCGGVSFRRFINRSALNSGLKISAIHIPGENYLSNNRNLLQLSRRQVQRLQKRTLRVIANHSWYNTHRYYHLSKIQHPFYYTILREPVARWVSHYNYFYYKLGYAGCQGIALNDLPKEKRQELLQQISNVQVQYIAGHGLGTNFDNQELLEIAKYNLLNGYADFGILENMETSLQRLQQRKPDWLTLDIRQFPRLNTNKLAISVASEISEQILSYNALDKELYDFALAHFYEHP